MKKTNTIKSESCPMFCQSFHFKVQDSLMDITSLCVSVFEVESAVVLYAFVLSLTFPEQITAGEG